MARRPGRLENILRDLKACIRDLLNIGQDVNAHSSGASFSTVRESLKNLPDGERHSRLPL